MQLKNITHNLLSNAWATLHRIDYDFKFKNGIWKRISRECYNRGNGTSILLYNPDKKTVILTQQFRMPAFENCKKDGMSIEVCAGALDENEYPQSCIIREVEEEVGIKINEVIKVIEAYMSPGAVTEKMFCFIGEYHDNMKVNNGGGVIDEDEEITVLELPFDTALNMIETHEIKDAKTIILLQYAKLHNLVQ